MSKTYQKYTGTATEDYTKGNVTTRRPAKVHRVKMASTHDSENAGADQSLFIDSFLSQGEIEEVKIMLDTERDLFQDKSIYTSTQMGNGKLRKPTLSLSPIGKGSKDLLRDTKSQCDTTPTSTPSLKLTNRFEALLGQEEVLNYLNKVGSIYQNMDTGR